MKITDVVVTLFEREMPVVPRWSPNGGKENMGVLQIETDEGITGSTFFGHRPTAEEIAHLITGPIKQLLVGRDPLERGALWKEMWARQNLLFPVIGSVDIALWDLAGRVANMPIHQLIGTYRTKLPAYCGHSGLGQQVGPYLDDFAAAREAGYQGYKLHCTGSLRADIEICRALRNAAGDDYPLMYDLHANFGFEGVLKIAQVLEELDFVWLEDPFPGDDMYNYSRLRERTRIPFLATETFPRSPYGHDQWLINHTTDYLRGDVINKGGITPLLQIAHLAEMFRIPFEVHHYAHSCNNTANLNVALAIPNAGMYEVNLPDVYFKYGMVTDVDVDSEGFVHAPTGPGLGHQIDWDLVKRSTVAVLR